MSNAPPPPSIDAAPPPPPPAPSASSPPASALPAGALPSLVPITMMGGEMHALSVPPGVTISHEPPPPTLPLQLVASLADTAAIVGLIVLMARHTLTIEGGVAAIIAVLAARAKPVRLGAQAVSGVATLLLAALRTDKTTPSATPPATPSQ